LDVPAARLQRAQAGLHHRLGADRVDGHLRTAAGQLDDLAGDLGDLVGALGGGRQPVLGAVPYGQVQRSRLPIHRDHPGARGDGDHHRGQPDPAATEHHHPLPRPHRGHRGHRPVGGGEPAAERGRGLEIDLLGQRDQVHLGVRNRHVLGEGSPVVETRLQLTGADLLVSGPALRTGAAGTDERHRHPVTRPPAGDLAAHLGDGAGQFMPGHVRQFDVRIVALPAVPVAATQAGGLDLHHHTVRPWCRVGHRDQ